MKFQEDDNQLIAQELPIRNWFLALISTPVLLYLINWFYKDFLELFNKFSSPEISWTFLVINVIYIFFFFLVILVIILGIGMFIFSPLVKIQINLISKTVNIINQKLIFKTENRFYFHQIKEFIAEPKKVDKDGDEDNTESNKKPQYLIALLLINGEKYFLENESSYYQTEKVEQLNAFLQKHLKDN